MFQRPTVTRAGLEADKAFKPNQPATTETEYTRMQKAFHDNRERLRSERLAREAAAAERSGKLAL
jgi:hypothetical protein